jgi:alanine dehydrogenase
MTANVARTASRALSNAALDYVQALGGLDGRRLDDYLRGEPGLRAGVYIFRGKLVQERVGETLGIPTSSLEL